MYRINRRIFWIVVALGLVVLPSLFFFSPDAAAQPGKAGEFVKFDQHVQHLAEATHAQYKALPTTKVATEAAFNEMKEHLHNHYKNIKVAHSFVGHDGHHIDCVPIDQQPTMQHPLLKGHKIQHTAPKLHMEPKAAPGKAPGANTQLVPAHFTPGMKDAHGNAMHAPEGTIPIRRITLTEMTKFQTLKQYFSKPTGAPGLHAKADPKLANFKLDKGASLKPDSVINGYTHRYAIGTQLVNNYGGAAWLNLWQPTPTQHQFSLSQVWYTGGSPVQTIEGGWQVYPDKYGHNKPVLFIYWTADGYNKTGAYNLDKPGFIQVNRSFTIGGAWSPLSAANGTQFGFRLVYYRDPANGNWWLYIQGNGGLTAIGYYPKALFGTGQMSKYATDIEYGGEVTGQTASGQMGSGAFAKTGWQHAAFQKEIYYFPTSGNSAWANLSGYQSNPSYYTVDVHNNTGGNWGSYFFFGGPGGK